jgi:hypothetical protein
MKSKLLLICLCFSATAFSQITLTHTDYANGLGEGGTFTSFATPLFGPALTVFVGEASGTPQTWDFTGYDFSQVGNGVGIDPSSAPFYSLFPDCNISLYEKAYDLGASTDTMYSWSYQELTSDQLLLHAMSDENEAWPVYDPPIVQAVMPFTYGTTWMEDWDSTFYMPEVWVISKTEVEVDAFGTMKLPQGDYPCVRLTQNVFTISHTPVGVDSSTVRNYAWYAKDLTQLHITSLEEDQFELSTIEINAMSYSKAGGPSAVDENRVSSKIGTLEQNTPNPFNSKTTINYTLTDAGNVVLKVYDYTGREIEILVNEEQPAGQYQVDFSGERLNSGLYFYKLGSGNESVMMKMMVVK